MLGITALILLCLPLVANAASFWEFDWETLPTQNRNATEGIFYQGNCFERTLGDPFTSVEVSTKYKRTGSKSARLHTDSRYANADGHRNCDSMWKTEKFTLNDYDTLKHRLEPRYGWNGTTGVNGFQSWNLNHERWFRYSFYLPSNEGNFLTTFSSGPYNNKKIMIMQIMAANTGTSGSGQGGTTHELSFELGAGPTINIGLIYGLTAAKGTEIPESLGKLPVKKDAWNDVIFMHVPNWQTPEQNPTGHGQVKIWLNCQDWTNCSPAVNYAGPAAIRWFIDRYFKGGNYEMHLPEINRQLVQYVDSHKIGIRSGETEAQMLALMADDYGAVPPDDDPPDPPDPSVVRLGAPIDFRAE